MPKKKRREGARLRKRLLTSTMTPESSLHRAERGKIAVSLPNSVG